MTGWPKATGPISTFEEADFPILTVSYPTIADAEFVHDVEVCMVCHEAYAKSFAHNVHRVNHCEDCHGPASRHVSSRGREPGSILSFKQLSAPQTAEVCLKCHEQNACTPGATWRTSVHAHHGLTCTNCHRSHYNVPPGTPATSMASTGANNELIMPVRFSEIPPAAEEATPPTESLPSLRGTSQHLGAVAPNVCYQCHCEKQEFQAIAHPHQICGPNGFNCTTCHDPHGQILEYSRKDLCLTCHTGSPTAAWHSSTHNTI
jgi:predicted CXXCH cytochrome family protein